MATKPPPNAKEDYINVCCVAQTCHQALRRAGVGDVHCTQKLGMHCVQRCSLVNDNVIPDLSGFSASFVCGEWKKLDSLANKTSKSVRTGSGENCIDRANVHRQSQVWMPAACKRLSVPGTGYSPSWKREGKGE